MSFSTLLTSINKVSKQLEVGLYNLKRIAFFLKKIAELDEAYVKDALKMIKNEASKKEVQQAILLLSHRPVCTCHRSLTMQNIIILKF